jgi:hypothetical protein
MQPTWSPSNSIFVKVLLAPDEIALKRVAAKTSPRAVRHEGWHPALP